VTDSIDDRYFGAQKAMFMRGLSIPDRWVVDDRDRKDFLVTEDGFPLPEGELPTAFFCNCDLSARVLVVQLQKMGYAVPGDISVVGFDHYLSGAQSPVPLTTYDTRIDAMAKKAVHVIRHHIMSPQYTNGITLIRGRFTQGKSAARIGDPVPLI
jgi:LacI family transcriptional regulator/LacI family purine nucleotide synthesis repressor